MAKDSYDDEDYDDADEDVAPLEAAIAPQDDESSDGFGVARASALQRPDADA